MAINISNYPTLPEQVQLNKENIETNAQAIASINTNLGNYVPFVARESDIELGYQSLDIGADNGFILETNSQPIVLNAHSGPILMYGNELNFNDCDIIQIIDNLSNNKQDNLTAGEGIDITNNVISATGGGMTSPIQEYNAIPTADENSDSFIYVNGVLYAKVEVE